ncbi:head GIN domain-containing protein [Sphingomonas sp. CFBP 13720]|uniref:head GIN domain-containing protein n=1 Tax=Sphingomonas sp. CFBP 13720 TaxID=2775302 RepID=UPI00177FE7EF|nr:head GIN domain-containing protein [Sphingomonas sp. CFBP 13720]MBD8678700.1 DUF2807 domain-containing protein [Sphingomonas sp. CFBP 13720]
MRIVILAAIALTGCNDGSPPAEPAGRAAVRDFAERDFTAVELDGLDRLGIRTGATFAVRAQGDATALERLDVRRDGDTLHIGRKPAKWRWTGDRTPAIRIEVTMPSIRAATLRGSGDIGIDRVQGDFTAALDGSGNIIIGQLRGRQARLNLGGSGTIAAAGAVEALALSVGGSGRIDAPQLRAGSADVSVAGSGDAVADVNGAARVTLAGSGSVTLGRNARCTVAKTGSGDVHCGG